MQDKIGFIYLWRDKKHDRFYIGSHWGNEDDGYVCSSSWMLQSYKKRPQDFKRRIIERFVDRSKANEIEHRWLQMIKKEELKKRYYNFHNYRFGHWSSDDNSRMTMSEKISTSTKKAMGNPEVRRRYEEGMKRRKKTCSEETRKKRSASMKKTMSIKFPAENRSRPMGNRSMKLRERWTDPEYRAKMSLMSREQRHTEESKRKISEKLKGHVVSEETRRKISETKRTRVNK